MGCHSLLHLTIQRSQKPSVGHTKWYLLRTVSALSCQGWVGRSVWSCVCVGGCLGFSCPPPTPATRVVRWEVPGLPVLVFPPKSPYSQAVCSSLPCTVYMSCPAQRCPLGAISLCLACLLSCLSCKKHLVFVIRLPGALFPMLTVLGQFGSFKKMPREFPESPVVRTLGFQLRA